MKCRYVPHLFYNFIREVFFLVKTIKPEGKWPRCDFFNVISAFSCQTG